MNNLSPEQLDELRDALETERASIAAELAEHGAKEEDGAWDPNSSGLSGEEADPADAADQIEELVTNVPIVQELSARAREIDSALQKMDTGRYGICEVGGEEISYDRLSANPAARTCLEHA